MTQTSQRKKICTNGDIKISGMKYLLTKEQEANNETKRRCVITAVITEAKTKQKTQEIWMTIH